MITSAEEMKQALCDKLTLIYGNTAEETTDKQMMRVCAMVLRDMMAQRRMTTRRAIQATERRQVHYLSVEFLLGRSLMKNAYNLGVDGYLREALQSLGFRVSDVLESEPDAGLGNGGLGRLAACYLDAMTTLEIPATGYSICYELGLFRQKITDGQQVELPDDWKDGGGAWLLPKPQETEEVLFGGTVRHFWEDGRMYTVQEGATRVLAVPFDMEIAGYRTEHTNTLRLWDARSPVALDMSLFSRGEYLQAVEQHAMAETIAKVLYPEDNHYEGKSLRLKQQYFFASATVQSAVRRHVETYGTLRNFHEKNIFQINDTHPAFAIPELMRILLDDAGLDWDTAWHITENSFAYTNHTVLAEALERWPQPLVQTLLPRVWEILAEIARRYEEKARVRLCDNAKLRETAIIWDGEVRMANLCVVCCTAVNGVSALHSEILRHDVFCSAFAEMPEKFQNVTNGIDHRRWLLQANPRLSALVRELCGEEAALHAEKLSLLERYAGDAGVLSRLRGIKSANKEDLARFVRRTQGVTLDPDTLFDVQAKRLHEYKRQLLNAMRILSLYLRLRDEPNREFVPQTCLFAAKAAPGYAVAKRIIRFIHSLAAQIEQDSVCRDRLKVVFLENYRVSLAEILIPASEVSEQISAAGKEASGTGNMKFMMNGALTIGTLDGANVEMHALLGDDNMFLFGKNAAEAENLRQSGYQPGRFADGDEMLRRVLDFMRRGFADGQSYDDLVRRLLLEDTYLLLADFDSYCKTHDFMIECYGNKMEWYEKSLHNIARSGVFSADRSVAEYAENIWHIPLRKRD